MIRCEHMFLAGMCEAEGCPHARDGLAKKPGGRRKVRSALYNGRTLRVLNTVGTDWARFPHAGERAERNRDSVMLARLVNMGLVERRIELDGKRREYRRKP